MHTLTGRRGHSIVSFTLPSAVICFTAPAALYWLLPTGHITIGEERAWLTLATVRTDFNIVNLRDRRVYFEKSMITWNL
jgi:hypothetical protein